MRRRDGRERADLEVGRFQAGDHEARVEAALQRVARLAHHSNGERVTRGRSQTHHRMPDQVDLPPGEPLANHLAQHLCALFDRGARWHTTNHDLDAVRGERFLNADPVGEAEGLEAGGTDVVEACEKSVSARVTSVPSAT